MKKVIVRYRIKADQVGENQKLIAAVFSELKMARPEGLRYASFLQQDGQSFVHVASIETPDGTNPLANLATFKAFQKDLQSRCLEAPVATEITEIGSYRVFSE